MRLIPSAAAIALGALLALSACKGREGQRSAAGEVLSGSVSDAMLPLDATTSQPPHAAARGPEAAGDAASDAASGADAPAADPTTPPAAGPAD